jgi:hypothetical protein
MNRQVWTFDKCQKQLLSKVAEAFLKHQSGEEEPAATDAANFSVPVETDAVAGSSWQPWSEQPMPVETGVPEAEEEENILDETSIYL